MDLVVSGLAIVVLFVAAVLIGVATTWDAHTQWSRMSARARRFVKSERRFMSSPRRRRRR
jgi:hypothetical protein